MTGDTTAVSVADTWRGDEKYRGISARKTIQHMMNGTLSGNFHIWRIALFRMLIIAVAALAFGGIYFVFKPGFSLLILLAALLSFGYLTLASKWFFDCLRTFFFGEAYATNWGSKPAHYSFSQRRQADARFWQFTGVYCAQILSISILQLGISTFTENWGRGNALIELATQFGSLYLVFVGTLAIVAAFAPMLGKAATAVSKEQGQALLHFRDGDGVQILLAALHVAFFWFLVPGILLTALIAGGLKIGLLSNLYVSGVLGIASLGITVSWLIVVQACFSASVYSQRARLFVADPLIEDAQEP